MNHGTACAHILTVMEKGKRKVFSTTEKSLLTLFYWRLNGEEVPSEKFFDMIMNESFKMPPSQARRRLDMMLRRGLVYVVNSSVRLTDRGMWLMEEREAVLRAIIYGHIMKGVTAREELRGIYQRIGTKVTGDKVQDRTDLILKRLRHMGAVDYTTERVWRIRKIDKRKENEWA